VSTGESQPPVDPPAGDADGDGINNATENAIETAVDSGARYQARIALITAIVALVSALLGPLVSLLINSSQIDAQRENNKEQANAERLQSESEFVRTERREAYTAFLGAYNNGAIDILGAAGTFSSPGADPKALSAQLQKAIDAVKEVTSTYYEVRIVASEEAFDEAEAAYAEFSRYAGGLLTAGGTLANGGTLTPEQVELVTGSNAEYQTLLSLSLAFIEKGRMDMSADSDTTQ
jgi:hypothetical protein